MMVFGNTVLGDTWRMAVTVAVLGLLALIWYFVVSRITPFPGTSGPVDEQEEQKFPQVQRFTLVADVVLFVWIVLEGAIIIPFMLIKYGLH